MNDFAPILSGVDVEYEELTADCAKCGKSFTFTGEIVIIHGERNQNVMSHKSYCSDECAKPERVVRSVEEQQRDQEEQAAVMRQHQLDQLLSKVWPRFQDVRPEDLISELAVTQPGDSIVLSGSTGVGKTRQAWAFWMRWALAVGKPFCVPQFFTAPDLLERIRRSFSGDPVDLDPYSPLVIDDLGVEKPSEWVVEQLYRIVDERYRMRQQLVVTTNCSGRELRDRLGDRVVSRLVEMCVPVKMTGGDYRLSGGAS